MFMFVKIPYYFRQISSTDAWQPLRFHVNVARTGTRENVFLGV